MGRPPPRPRDPAGCQRRRSAELGPGRGQSDVIAAVLLIGVVMTSASLIAMSGASVLDQYRELAGQESTTNTIEEIDTELSSVASVGGLTRAEFSIGDAEPSQYRIARSGHLNVTANRNASCRAHIPLSSLRYDRDDGVLLGFEAGGVFRQERGLLRQTVVHTPPDVTFDNGTLTASIIDFSGGVDGSKNLVYENITESIETNRDLEDAMFQDGCSRPDNVTISVQSDFYRGWSGYLERSMDGSAYHTFDSNRTARVYFSQDDLPIETNDSRNDVVDLTSDEFNEVDVSSDSIEVDKSADNTYTTIVTPLSSGSTQVGEVRVIEDDDAYRPPLDVVFVIDESGSMGNPPGTSKLDQAKAAAKAFVGRMNESHDRAGGVAFEDDDDAHYLYNASTPPRHQVYLTDDFDAVNDSIDTLYADGGTYSDDGIRRGLAMHGLKSNSSRKKVIILLADGKDDGGDPIAAAEEADREGITIHTISFGNPPQAANETLQDVASVTGGTWRFSSESDDLSAVFVDLFAEISESKQVVRDPLSMRLEAGGTTFYPQIDGETGHLATGADDEFNLNDPTAPSNFSYSIDVSDGDNVTMTAVDYDCDDWGLTGRVYENESNGQEYAEVRCTEIDETTGTEVPASETNVYVDGDDVSALLDEPNDWWNDDLRNRTLAPYLDGPDDETLDVESNQALVVFEFDDGDGAADRLLVLYRIGQSREESIPKHVFNLEVRHLVIGDEE